MIITVEGHNAREHRALLDEMYRLRARVFRDRLKWDVRVEDGMERDRYDDEAPVYLIYADERRRIRGSLRLLPTTGPTLLADIFGETVPDAVLLSAPSIWECTRFCLDEDLLNRDGKGRITHAAGTLLAGLGKLALARGIETILGNFDPAMLRVYRRIGCEVDILGRTERYGRSVYLGAFPVSAEILRRIQARLRIALPPARPAAELELAG